VSEQGSNHETPDAALAPAKRKGPRPWKIRVRLRLSGRWYSHHYKTKQSRDQAIEVFTRIRPSEYWEHEAIDP